jgi:thiamine biosynthesis protein ThiS
MATGGARMNLILNGESRGFAGVDDVAGLVSALGLDARKVAVERNLEIVPRSAYGRTPLADGDRIEIVHFIGGG